MNSRKEIQHIYLVGAKSLGAYGGYETFVYKLTEYHQNKENIKYHVACKANGDGCMDESKFDGVTKINDHEFEFHNAHCFKIDVPQIGPAQAIYYDVAALKACCEHIKKNHIPHPIVYIMACRIGPFASHFYREIHKLGGTVYLNPDGHEWMRAKWSAPIRKYWKISEQMMVKYCDLAICDSVNVHQFFTVHIPKFHRCQFLQILKCMRHFLVHQIPPFTYSILKGVFGNQILKFHKNIFSSGCQKVLPECYRYKDNSRFSKSWGFFLS